MTAIELTHEQAQAIVCDAARSWRDELGGDICKYASDGEVAGYENAKAEIDAALQVVGQSASAASANKAPRAFTVILQYPDDMGGGCDTWMGAVDAVNAIDAIDMARYGCLEDNAQQGTDPEADDYADTEDLYCIAVMAGSHQDLRVVV